MIRGLWGSESVKKEGYMTNTVRSLMMAVIVSFLLASCQATTGRTARA